MEALNIERENQERQSARNKDAMEKFNQIIRSEHEQSELKLAAEEKLRDALLKVEQVQNQLTAEVRQSQQLENKLTELQAQAAEVPPVPPSASSTTVFSSWNAWDQVPQGATTSSASVYGPRGRGVGVPTKPANNWQLVTESSRKD